MEDTKSGSILLQSTWLTLSDSPEDLSQQLLNIRNLNARCTMYSAILLVFLDSAKHLPNVNRGADEPSAQVFFSVTGSKDSSAIRPHSNDPVWEESFRFLLHNPEIQDLTVEVIDTKSNKPIGMTRIHTCRLLREKDMQIEEPFALLGAGPNSKLLMTLQLKILVPIDGPSGYEKKLMVDDSNIDSASLDGKDKNSEPSTLPDLSPSARPLSPTIPTIQDMVQTSVAPAVDSLDLRGNKHNTPPPGSPTKSLPPSEKDSSPKSSPIKTPSPIKKTSSPPSLSGDSIKSNRSNRSTGSYGHVQLTVRYSIPRNKLVVVVHKAKNLSHKEGEDKPDPYVKIYMQPDRNKETKQKTQVCRGTCNPTFDESLEFELNMSEVANYNLEVTVNSKSGSGMFSRGRVLGRVIIELSQLDLTKAATEWYELEAGE